MEEAGKKGWLSKKRSGWLFGSWEKYWFVLQGAFLYYYETKYDRLHRGVIPLAAARLCVCKQAHNSRSRCFSITSDIEEVAAHR
jgi:hypothetical protein